MILGIILLLLVGTAQAAQVDYDFQTVDIQVPGVLKPTFAEDIGEDGDLVATTFINGAATGVIVEKGRTFRNLGQKVVKTFSCGGDTYASAISNSNVVGYCFTPNDMFGYVRRPDGTLFLLDVPGSDQTSAFGIWANRQIIKVTGQVVLPFDPNRAGTMGYRFKGWIWDSVSQQYTQINFEHPNTYGTYVDCGAMNRDSILCRYGVVTAGNDTLEQGWFLRNDNGSISQPFPQTFEHVGGPGVEVTDLNDDGAAIILLWNRAVPSIQLYDDGIFYDVTGFPATWMLSRVGGMNNKGQFVGQYWIQNGVDQWGFPKNEYHGFVATPKPVRAAGKR